MERLLTGLQPSGALTIGNYAGGVSQIVNYQNEHSGKLPNSLLEISKTSDFSAVVCSASAAGSAFAVAGFFLRLA